MTQLRNVVKNTERILKFFDSLIKVTFQTIGENDQAKTEIFQMRDLALKALEMRWRLIEEAPNEQIVLLYMPEYKGAHVTEHAWIISGWKDNGKWKACDSVGWRNVNPTHFMLLEPLYDSVPIDNV
jgi:hypothetical protein